ncbi:hypothetical protein BC830DRAFT_1168026 [Chytriomyces sp. MP71]|nr:hypothetical protein BC830DRAFT_1168026 [Chytriomyces sp. MP71]
MFVATESAPAVPVATLVTIAVTSLFDATDVPLATTTAWPQDVNDSTYFCESSSSWHEVNQEAMTTGFKHLESRSDSPQALTTFSALIIPEANNLSVNDRYTQTASSAMFSSVVTTSQSANTNNFASNTATIDSISTISPLSAATMEISASPSNFTVQANFSYDSQLQAAVISTCLLAGLLLLFMLLAVLIFMVLLRKRVITLNLNLPNITTETPISLHPVSNSLFTVQSTSQQFAVAVQNSQHTNFPHQSISSISMPDSSVTSFEFNTIERHETDGTVRVVARRDLNLFPVIGGEIGGLESVVLARAFLGVEDDDEQTAA